MSRQYKRNFTMYPAWSYQKEIEELNRQSEQGWQLIRGGAFSSRYHKNPDVCYRYQLDYSGKVEDLARYIETFREQGWEYINTTFNGWTYFRKPWDPAVPKEQYEIFTDQSSLREMTGRWIKFAAIVLAIIATLLVYHTVRLVRMPQLPTLLIFFITLLETAILVCGILRMRTSSKKGGQNRSFKWDRAFFTVFIAAAILGNSLYIFLIMHRNFRCVCTSEEMAAIPAEIENAMEWIQFDIPYTDNYYMDLEFTADSPMCFSIINGTNNGSGEIVYTADSVVYTVTEASMSVSKAKLHLDKGTYLVYLSNYEGGGLDLTLSIE